MTKKSVQAKSTLTVTKRPGKPARANKATASAPPAEGTKSPAATSKSDQVLSLLKRADGATLDDLMKATHWQSHSVRGFLSGAVRKRMGLLLVSEVSEQGLRRYRIAGEAGA